MIKGFIFDLDGVITETANMHFQAWKNMAKTLNIDLQNDMEHKLRGVSRDKCLEIILNENEYKKLTERDKEKLTNYKNDEYKKLISTISTKDILPNMLENLKFLKSHKIKIALASVSKNAKTIIMQLGILDYFDFIVDIEKVHKNKPDPEIFINAIKGLGLLKEESIVVDDSNIGIDATKKGSIKSIGIGVKGDYTFTTTKELTINEIENILEVNK